MNSPTDPPLTTFEDVAASRRAWIDDVLHPWARQANRKQLLQAAAEWTDIAGRVDMDATLWTWAWERFPGLTHPELSGVNETHQIVVTLKDGTEHQGYPDSRQSVKGQLCVLQRDAETTATRVEGPFSIDDIQQIVICD